MGRAAGQVPIAQGREGAGLAPSSGRIWTLPNLLTVSRILLAPLFLALFFSKWGCGKQLALLTFGLASLTDLYDGHLARKGGEVTAVGRFLDPLADKILASAALIAFVMTGLVSFWLVAVIVGRDVLVTLLRVYALYNGKQIATSKLARYKTSVQLAAIFVILGAVNLQMAFSGELGGTEEVANLLIGIVTLLTVVSGVQYLLRRKYVP